MQASNLAAKIKKAFAILGTKNTIPLTPSSTAGEASYETGFPPLTMTPIVAGGIPPKGADFNGIFYELSNALQSQQAAGLMPWDSDFSIAIGGYPKNSFVTHSNKAWVSLVENNAVEPSTDITKWISIPNINDFSSNLLASGYQKYPNGLIVQWGTIVNPAGVANTAYTNAFPITFPNQILQVVGGNGDMTAQPNAVIGLALSTTPPTPSAFTWVSNVSGSIRFTYTAFGF